ncbi:replicative DNA helicase [Actinoalloteichus sp. GBA129-24]|uniref:replicative DNA helicase n=1 Tax=Actinoalloteichus sp. GBA129-24 TaxID=1612551 RepID=UPI0009509197|nr:replicative DNA helicase [Actinoalloteichus sp. GBA129-24]APU20902.1 replicative DNA helicase [Actinoalloteichus sp. GBA129-24]APU24151.1 replicative DNA helicase [Actinoalloteichus sp. GBA129-24]
MTEPAIPDTLPQDEAAERGVLGAMLLDNRVIGAVANMIAGGDFYRLAHQVIYESIRRLDDRGDPADPVTVAAELDAVGQLARVGDRPYLVGLLGDAPVGGSATYYAAIVAEKAMLRRVVAAGQQITQVGMLGGDGAPVEDVLEAAQQALFGVHGQADDDLSDLDDLYSETSDWLDDPTEEPGLPTGLADLDRLLRITPGSVTVVAARPGVGKSVLGVQLAAHVAAAGSPALICSLEMSKRELMLRIMASDARVNLSDLVAKKLSDADRMKVAKAQGKAKGRPLRVTEMVSGGVAKIRRYVADAARRGEPYSLVVVDYLQLMQHHDPRVSQRQQQVSEMSRALKLMAKEFGVPVVVASQLNRNSETRQDKKPLMSELRESGAIEQDADNVLLLHRDDDLKPGEIEIIIAKQRQGPTGVVVGAFQGHYQRIVCMSNQLEP